MNHRMATVRRSSQSGRPRKVPRGHSSGTGEVRTRTKCGPERGTLDSSTSARRLLNLEDAAAYLGVSPWTVRDLDAAGVLSRVRVPLPHGRELRKLLFDRAELDRLIEAWKDPVA
jgi:helix-turn-helix protein